MTKFKKLLHRFFENPASLHYSDIEKILIKFGCIKVFAKGSHVKFKHINANSDLIIPVHNNDCKDFYKISALKYAKLVYLNINYENVN